MIIQRLYVHKNHSVMFRYHVLYHSSFIGSASTTVVLFQVSQRTWPSCGILPPSVFVHIMCCQLVSRLLARNHYSPKHHTCSSRMDMDLVLVLVSNLYVYLEGLEHWTLAHVCRSWREAALTTIGNQPTNVLEIFNRLFLLNNIHMVRYCRVLIHV